MKRTIEENIKRTGSMLAWEVLRRRRRGEVLSEDQRRWLRLRIRSAYMQVVEQCGEKTITRCNVGSIDGPDGQKARE